MLTEVSVAVSFVTSFLYGKLPRRRVLMLGEELDKAIQAKFRGHWYPDQPLKGTAYRCLKLSGDNPNLLLFEAAREIGLEAAEILQHLPDSLTLWIDPGEVSYRIGEKGAVSVLYTDKGHDESPSEFNPEAQDFVPASEQLLLAQNFAQLGLGQLYSSQQQQQQDLINYSQYMLQKSSSAPNFFTAAAFAQTKFGSTKLRQQTRRTAGGRSNGGGFGDSSGRRGAASRAVGGGGGFGAVAGAPLNFSAQQPPIQASLGRHSTVAAASTVAFNRSVSMSPGIGYSSVDWSTGLGGPGGSDVGGQRLSVHIPTAGASYHSSNGSSRQTSPGAAAAAAAAAAASAALRAEGPCVWLTSTHCLSESVSVQVSALQSRTVSATAFAFQMPSSGGRAGSPASSQNERRPRQTATIPQIRPDVENQTAAMEELLRQIRATTNHSRIDWLIFLKNYKFNSTAAAAAAASSADSRTPSGPWSGTDSRTSAAGPKDNPPPSHRIRRFLRPAGRRWLPTQSTPIKLVHLTTPPYLVHKDFRSAIVRRDETEALDDVEPLHPAESAVHAAAGRPGSPLAVLNWWRLPLSNQRSTQSGDSRALRLQPLPLCATPGSSGRPPTLPTEQHRVEPALACSSCRFDASSSGGGRGAVGFTGTGMRDAPPKLAADNDVDCSDARRPPRLGKGDCVVWVFLFDGGVGEGVSKVGEVLPLDAASRRLFLPLRLRYRRSRSRGRARHLPAVAAESLESLSSLTPAVAAGDWVRSRLRRSRSSRWPTGTPERRQPAAASEEVAEVAAAASLRQGSCLSSRCSSESQPPPTRTITQNPRSRSHQLVQRFQVALPSSVTSSLKLRDRRRLRRSCLSGWRLLSRTVLDRRRRPRLLGLLRHRLQGVAGGEAKPESEQVGLLFISSASISCSKCTSSGTSRPNRAPALASSSRHSTTLRGFFLPTRSSVSNRTQLCRPSARHQAIKQAMLSRAMKLPGGARGRTGGAACGRRRGGAPARSGRSRVDAAAALELSWSAAAACTMAAWRHSSAPESRPARKPSWSSPGRSQSCRQESQSAKSAIIACRKASPLLNPRTLDCCGGGGCCGSGSVELAVMDGAAGIQPGGNPQSDFISLSSVGPGLALGPLELHLEPLGANLEAVHRLDGRGSRGRVVEADEAEALALVGGPVYVHLGRDHRAERGEHLGQFRVAELLRQVVDEQVAAVGPGQDEILRALLVLHRHRDGLLGQRHERVRERCVEPGCKAFGGRGVSG
uniref:Anti_prolifrtn domain-containing protein n=1 Tax=Macrostomum lignano TaxID=282301 RepID=A0A1I8IP16_9PLAT